MRSKAISTLFVGIGVISLIQWRLQKYWVHYE